MVCNIYTRFGVALSYIVDPNDSSLRKSIVVIKFGVSDGVSIDENNCIPDDFTDPVTGEGKILLY